MTKKLFITVFSFLSLVMLAQNDTNWVKYYFESGQISSEGPLRDGKPDGYWKSYYIDGKLKTEGNRLNFLLDGDWKFYDVDGRLTLIIGYKEDLKEGQRITLDGEGTILKEEEFVKNKKEGWTTSYFANGKLKMKTPFVNNREQGRGFEYDGEEQIITLFTYKAGVLTKEQFINRRDDNGLRKGTWMNFHDNMQVSDVGMYMKDLKHGYWKYYKKDGNLIRIEKWVMGVLVTDDDITGKIEMRREKGANGRIASMGPYRNGKKDGLHEYYDENGAADSAKVFESDILLAEGAYDDLGRKQKTWKYYYATGELKERGDYKDDKKVGKWEYFFIGGQLEQMGSFIKDKPNGTWYWYYPDKELRKEQSFANGLEDGMSIEYSDSGTVLAQGEFIDGMEEGEWFYTYANVVERGEFYEGEKQGKWISKYVDSEKMFFEGNFVNSQPDGQHSYYYSNGVIKRKEYYKNGVKEGIWEYFDTNGVVYLTIEHKDGREVKYNGVKISYGRRVDRELEAEEQEN